MSANVEPDSYSLSVQTVATWLQRAKGLGHCQGVTSMAGLLLDGAAR